MEWSIQSKRNILILLVTIIIIIIISNLLQKSMNPFHECSEMILILKDTRLKTKGTKCISYDLLKNIWMLCVHLI